MFIKVIPTQIPRMWENIKYAISHTSDISEKDLPLYLNNLLHALLSSKAHCIVRLDDNRNLLTICITRIIADNITGKDVLFIESIYSFAKIPTNLWEEAIALIIKLAKKENCTRITTYSANPKIFEVVKEIGFTEYYRYFIMEV